MGRGLRDRITRPLHEQPVRLGLVLIAVGTIDIVLSRGFGIGIFASARSWISDSPILLLGGGLVLYGRLRRPPPGRALALLLLLSGVA